MLVPLPYKLMAENHPKMANSVHDDTLRNLNSSFIFTLATLCFMTVTGIFAGQNLL
jgi:hypothetical protein